MSYRFEVHLAVTSAVYACKMTPRLRGDTIGYSIQSTSPVELIIWTSNATLVRIYLTVPAMVRRWSCFVVHLFLRVSSSLAVLYEQHLFSRKGSLPNCNLLQYDRIITTTK